MATSSAFGRADSQSTHPDLANRELAEGRAAVVGVELDAVVTGQRKDPVRMHLPSVPDEQLDAGPIDQHT